MERADLATRSVDAPPFSGVVRAVLDWYAGLFPPSDVVEESPTRLRLPAPPAEVWRSLKFYEEVPSRPGVLLRIGLPAPVRSEGEKTRMSGTVRCIYEGGYVLKRTTSTEPPNVLRLEVFEQRLVSSIACHSAMGCTRSVRCPAAPRSRSPRATGATSVHVPCSGRSSAGSPAESTATSSRDAHRARGSGRAVGRSQGRLSAAPGRAAQPCVESSGSSRQTPERNAGNPEIGSRRSPSMSVLAFACSQPAGITATSGRTSVVMETSSSTRPWGETTAARRPCSTPAARAASGWMRTTGVGSSSRMRATCRNCELM